MGVIKKKTHMFSVNFWFTLESAPSRSSARKIENREAVNRQMEISLHLSGATAVFSGWLYR